MKVKKIISLLLVMIIATLSFTITSFARELKEPYFNFTETKSTEITPYINSDGSFTFGYSSRLHSDTFTATGDKISLSFITTTGTKAFYYIALYDMTNDPINPTFKSMTQSKDDKLWDSATFNVTKGRRYRLTFSKVNGGNYDWVSGRGSISGIKK